MDDEQHPWLFDDDTDGRPDPEDVKLGLALPSRRRVSLRLLTTQPNWRER